MKNLLVYVNPSKEFGEHYERLIKMQIDNSLRLGWDRKDIILATNFDYEYYGVKSLVVPDSCYCGHRPRATKANVVCYLLEEGLVDDLCWYHDPDAFQLIPFKIDLEGKDVGFVMYKEGEWNSGSFFFTPTSKDVFGWIKQHMYKYRRQDEHALYFLTRKNVHNINSRIKVLNCTYNLCRIRGTNDYYELADKPINVFHFDPNARIIYREIKPLLPKELIEIINKHRMTIILIYIGIREEFTEEHKELTQMQIDNSLGLGWRSEDILLVTDFPYKYRGVESYVVDGEFQALDGNRSSKILVINQLFKDGMIDGLCWFHDHDAFQLRPMRDPELGNCVAGFTNEGWSNRWNAGSFFFTEGAKHLFQKIYDTMIERNTNEQDALTYLWDSGMSSYKLLNNAYNMGIYHIPEVYNKIEKPLLVAHFHPHKPKHLALFKPHLPERLERILNGYNIK